MKSWKLGKIFFFLSEITQHLSLKHRFAVGPLFLWSIFREWLELNEMKVHLDDNIQLFKIAEKQKRKRKI